jgi:hypothetical protein
LLRRLRIGSARRHVLSRLDLAGLLARQVYLLFACIAYVCIWRAGDSLVLIQDPKAKQRYQRLYQSLGVAMVLCPLAAWAFISLLPIKKTVIFFVELAGIYVFALYWVIKSREASRTQLDEKAQSGKVTARPQGVSHVFRASPLTVH